MMLDRVTGMQVFAQIAALGSFSAAARAMGMSQTMATKHVAALEERLGVKLLHRTTRKVTPTEAGKRFLESVERVLAELSEAEASAAASQLEVRGALRVNVPVSFGISQVSPLLPEFSRLYPAVRLDLGLNDRVVDLVEEGWDLAIRIGSLTEPALIARKLAECSTVVCAAPSYLARHGTPKSAADLIGHNCLGYTLSSTLGVDRWSFGADGAISVPVAGNLRANNGDALVAAAVAGQGIIYQPAYLVEHELRAGRLVPISLEQPTLELAGVFAVYPSDRHPRAKVRAFVDFLVERFGSDPWEQPSAGTRAKRRVSPR